MSCIFCEIAAGRIPAKLAYADEHVVAFHDVSPQAPTHVLVIPRVHLPDLDAATPTHIPTLGHLLWVARELAGTLGLAGGYRLVVNRGPDGGQSVNHLHVHLLGGRAMQWPPGWGGRRVGVPAGVRPDRGRRPIVEPPVILTGPRP